MLKKFVWWIGVPILAGLIVWGPYWEWNIVHHVAAWWRVKMIGGAIFDTYEYLDWMADILRGLNIGGHLRWFAWPLVWMVRPAAGASLPEQWFVTRWITTTLMVWIGAWSVRPWTGLKAWPARLVSVCLWLSLVLVLGMRPGIYSWYLPFCFFGLAAARRAWSELESSRWLPALGWTAGALAATSVYTHVLIFAVLWLSVMWGAWVIRRSRRIFIALFAAGTGMTVWLCFLIAAWLTGTPQGIIFLQLQERIGLAYTHLPLIANSLFVILGWLALLMILQRAETAARTPHLEALVWAWITMLLTWFMTPFTGIYIQNDHFRTVVVLLSWVSLAAVWSQMRERLPSVRRSKIITWIMAGVFVSASGYLLHIMHKPYAFNGDFLDVLHFSQWFALWVGAGLLLIRGREWPRWMSAVPFVLLIGSLLIGGVGMAAAFREEFARLERFAPREPALDWIASHVDPDQTMCADPDTAEFFYAQTGRRAYPAQASLTWPEPDAVVLQRLMILAGAFDARAAGLEDSYRVLSTLNQNIACNQFSLADTVLHTLHVSPQKISELNGCPQALLDQHWVLVSRALQEKKVDASAFTRLCPFVIVPNAMKTSWHLPAGYVEHSFDGLSVWVDGER